MKNAKPEKEKNEPVMTEWIPPVLGKHLSVKTDLDKQFENASEMAYAEMKKNVLQSLEQKILQAFVFPK